VLLGKGNTADGSEDPKRNVYLKLHIQLPAAYRGIQIITNWK
jgi:hypothetical protein